MTEFAWHVHHKVLVEPLRGSLEERIEFIKEHKPPKEIETRLRLLKKVVGALPEAFVEAGEALMAAEQWPESKKLFFVWFAYIQCQPAIEALHKQECLDCPWDGNTIFPEATQ